MSQEPSTSTAPPPLAPRRKKEQPRGRWCFTLNNPTPEEKDVVAGLDTDLFKYIIVGQEVGESGTPHLQGFVNLKKKKTLKSMKSLISNRAHFEPARGSDDDNKKYCGKDGNILIEAGTPQFQGKRTDLDQLVSELLETKSLSVIAEKFPAAYVRYHRGLNQLMLDHPATQTYRQWKTDVICFIGPPGCGKSRAVAMVDPSAYWKPRGKWWCGYSGQETVILDDFYGWIPFDDLLRLCDRYPLRVETKGGSRPFVARKIYITSNALPSEWYNPEFGNISALYRRITEIKWWDELAKDFNPPPHYVFPHKINF
uniref:Replication-associated protein n=1 Tax=Barbastella barbastellus feces associated circovirus 2 TaxID=3139968 RepID=A0AAU6S516_9CIRC